MAISGIYTYSAKTIGHYFVWFGPRVNAVYGNNGSGKSYLLESILKYLNGHRDIRGGVLIRISDIESITFKRGTLEHFFTAPSLARHLIDTPYVDPHDSTWFDADPVHLEDLKPVEDNTHNREIIEECNRFGYLLLEPTGHTPTSWQVWPLVFPTSDTPALNAEIGKWNRFGSTVAEIESKRSYSPTDPLTLDDEVAEELDSLWLENEDLHHSLLANSQTLMFLTHSSRRVGSNHHGAVFLRSPGQSQANLNQDIVTDALQPRLNESVHEFDVDELTRTFLEECTVYGPEDDSDGYRERQVARIIGLDPNLFDDSGFSSLDAASEHIQRSANTVSITAREILGNLLLDPIPLELRLGTISDIWAGKPATWGYADGIEFIPLDDFSDSQRRWARFAIRLALDSWRENTPGMKSLDVHWPTWLIDEPERGMHRQAEEHLAKGLTHLAERFSAQAFIATHSPEIINDPQVNIIHARRSPEGSTFGAISSDEIASLQTLGLRPSDLLNRVRLFVIVEGEHEKVLFSEFFASEFAKNRIEILVARGASNFDGIFDSQLISKFSNARVLLTIDNQQATEVTEAWESALALASRDSIGAAEAYLRESLPAGKKAENKFLREFMLAAMRAGETDRISVFGFSRPDIVEYLPSFHFTRRDSWEDLRAEWEQSGSQKQFKPWLEKSHGANFDSGNLRSAALSMDTVPEDFLQFLKLCLQLSEESPTQISPEDFR